MVSGDPLKHEIISSENVFDGRVVKVFLDDVRLPDGRQARWERVCHPGAVGMVPLRDDGNLLMVRQYRHAVRGELLEIPAGKLDRGERPIDCARRELVEEVGHSAGDMVPLAEFYNSPGFSDEYFYLYLARELVPEEGRSEPDEFLQLVTVSLEQALGMLAEGEIKDAKSIIGITLATLFLRGEIDRFRGTADQP